MWREKQQLMTYLLKRTRDISVAIAKDYDLNVDSFESDNIRADLLSESQHLALHTGSPTRRQLVADIRAVSAKVSEATLPSHIAQRLRVLQRQGASVVCRRRADHLRPNSARHRCKRSRLDRYGSSIKSEDIPRRSRKRQAGSNSESGQT